MAIYMRIHKIVLFFAATIQQSFQCFTQRFQARQEDFALLMEVQCDCAQAN